LDLLIVYGVDPTILTPAPGGRDNAVMVSKFDFESLTYPHNDGNYFLRPDRILGMYVIHANYNDYLDEEDFMSPGDNDSANGGGGGGVHDIYNEDGGKKVFDDSNRKTSRPVVTARRGSLDARRNSDASAGGSAETFMKSSKFQSFVEKEKQNDVNIKSKIMKTREIMSKNDKDIHSILEKRNSLLMKRHTRSKNHMLLSKKFSRKERKPNQAKKNGGVDSSGRGAVIEERKLNQAKKNGGVDSGGRGAVIELSRVKKPNSRSIVNHDSELDDDVVVDDDDAYDDDDDDVDDELSSISSDSESSLHGINADQELGSDPIDASFLNLANSPPDFTSTDFEGNNFVEFEL
jgi:hypothetical protein